MDEINSATARMQGFCIRALSCPAATQPYRINWRYSFAVGTYHLLALLALDVWFFSWIGVLLAVAGVYVFGAVGINLCYHRLLSHRGFSCPLWLEHTFALIAVCLYRGYAGQMGSHPSHTSSPRRPGDGSA